MLARLRRYRTCDGSSRAGRVTARWPRGAMPGPPWTDVSSQMCQVEGILAGLANAGDPAHPRNRTRAAPCARRETRVAR